MKIVLKLIKKMIMSTPILKIVDLDKDFLVFIDAFNTKIGVLMQERYVICYTSLI